MISIWWLIACPLLAAGMVGLAFLLLVGQAFGRRERPGAKAFSHFVLGPGVWLRNAVGGSAAAAMVFSWIVWTGAFVAVAKIVSAMR